MYSGFTKKSNSSGHSHMKTENIKEKKGAPENIFSTENKEQSRNISTLHKYSTIMENSKKSTNESTQND